jgi:hypothetical protein
MIKRGKEVKYVFLETIFFFYFFLGLELVKFEDRSIVLKPADPVGRSGIRSIRSWNRVGLKKKRGKEKPGVTRQDLIANPLTFFFY